MKTLRLLQICNQKLLKERLINVLPVPKKPSMQAFERNHNKHFYRSWRKKKFTYRPYAQYRPSWFMLQLEKMNFKIRNCEMIQHRKNVNHIDRYKCEPCIHTNNDELNEIAVVYDSNNLMSQGCATALSSTD